MVSDQVRIGETEVKFSPCEKRSQNQKHPTKHLNNAINQVEVHSSITVAVDKIRSVAACQG